MLETDVEVTPDMCRLYMIATQPYLLHEDGRLREMTTEEREALSAYVERRLDLPGPPTFLSCTIPALKRAAMMAYHSEQVEGKLIADVPARVQLGRNISRGSLLRELAGSNAQSEEGKRRMRNLIKAAQRIVFDGNHTVTFVFKSSMAAGKWNNAELKLRNCAIQLHWA